MDFFEILVIIAFVLWFSGFYFLFRIPVCRKSSRKLNHPSVSIIIPARNEELNIGRLLDSINAQERKPSEVIVVNDNSTDLTKEISLSKGATVIDSLPLPQGWLGKPWACMQGAKSANSDLLVFLDSDTVLEEGGLIKILDTFTEDEKNPVISILPFHNTKHFYEGFSAIFNIIMAGSMNAFTPSKNPKPTGLFGQSLIVSRDNYFKINGHELVKDKILENVFLAEKFSEMGIALKCLGGKGTLSMCMYPDGFRNLINGWTKAFASGAGRTAPLSLFMIILWISTGNLISIMTPVTLITGGNYLIWLILYAVYAVQMIWLMKRTGTFRIITAMIFPLQLMFYCIVFFRSLYYQKTGKTIKWKSRDVKSEGGINAD